MAVAGLQNVPALDPSILRGASSSSLALNGNQEAPSSSSSPSSILKMWKELEDEWLATRTHGRLGGGILPRQECSSDGHGSDVSISNLPEGQSTGGFAGSQENRIMNDAAGETHARTLAESELGPDTPTEQSQGFGEAERERVRQIFREWMDTGRNGLTSNSPSSYPRAQLLDHTELERVRIVREWIQMASQRRDGVERDGEEQGSGVGSQIERVREGLVLDRSQVQTDNSRRDRRKLLGRQALVDLLDINKQETQKELQALSERSPVSGFAYRNRIQSLLRIRLLHNGRTTENSRPNAVAESELGLLRERQTVSGLREGFLLRLDNNINASNNLSSGGSSNNDNRHGQNEANNSSAAQVVGDEHGEAGSVGERTCARPSSDPVDSSLSNTEVINSRGSTFPRESRLELEVATNCGSEENVYENQEQVCSPVSSGNLGGELDLLQETLDSSHGENLSGSEYNGIHDDVSPDSLDDVNTARNSSAEDADLAISQESSRPESEETGHLDDPHELLHDRLEDGDSEEEEHNLDNESPQLIDLEDDHSEHLDSHGSSISQEEEEEGWVVQVQELEMEDQGWSARAEEENNQEQWPGGDGGVSLDHAAGDDALANEHRDNLLHPDMSVWDESRSQVDAYDSWLPTPSETGMTSTGRAHFFDDDRAHGMELRELVSRRRVSSLLQSGFRDSLDQLIQSYVERRSHNTPDDWEMHELLPPPPPLAIHDQGPFADNGDGDHDHDHDGDGDDNDNDNEESSDLDENSDILGSIPMPPPLPSWEQQFRRSHWSREFHQRPGIELEMINDLRIEMARIQHRLNNMQRMLEACMDMQLELQRSVRQEVSAALNRSSRSSEAVVVERAVAKGGSKWDHVRKGICCLCSESSIDSLLYRCGHMCTCTKCANLLMEGKGKCPMCKAPVVEVIRAYTIQ